MKAGIAKILVIGSLLACSSIQSSAGIVGYVNHTFALGDNLFENPLTQPGSDNLSSLFDPQTTPDGTTVSLWNPTTLSYSTTSVFSGGHWSLDLILDPGNGARLTTYVPFINTFVGLVTDRQGNYTNPDLSAPAPVFSGPNGVYLLGDKPPIAAVGTDVFTHVIGRLPNPGEEIIRLDAATQTYITSTYNGLVWDNQPIYNVGDSLFFDIGGVAFTPPPLTVVPEPGTGTFVLLGGVLCGIWRRRRA
jgi:hypothetical protein